MTYQPIENYGIVGDLHTVALIGMNGSVDFLCLPHFDSPSVFAALLDHRAGGHFQLAPELDDARQKQLYLPDTNVLLSRFLSHTGVAEISDFMPIEHAVHTHSLVRRAKTVRGEIRFRMVCQPRFDYARAQHRVDKKQGEVLFVAEGAGTMALRLRTAVPVRVENGAAIAEFTLRAGESAAFVLEQALPGVDSPSSAPDFVPETFKETVNFWRRWMSRSTYQGRWYDMVHRSALTLKLLVSQPYGAIVAAPTFGLPEEIRGTRNWDYRYTWIRDASFTLYGLLRLGYTDEAAAFMKWIAQRCGELEPDGALQVVYGIDGRHHLEEQTLAHLEGYMGSAPVRVGNHAYQQLQLDIYGELMDSVYLYDKYGAPISYDLWSDLVRLLDWVCANWRQPDEGIWEIRSGRREFLYSRVMCWVALDRGLRLARKRSLPAPLDRWETVRNEIHREVFTSFWNAERQAFVHCKGSTGLDAAALLMPMVKFIGPTDPRWLSTLCAISRDLVDDSLVYRYSGDTFRNGVAGKEGTFTMCSFWFVECLSRSGDIDRARFYFEKAIGYANHLGLFAEELGPRGEHLGNFPQAFTHLGLISAAFDLNRRLTGAGHTV